MSELITVIIPVYNVEKYISKCIDSVLGQTYDNLEVILIDDGSTDNSGIICDGYAQKNDNVIVIHKQNGGLSSARNAGMKILHGKYVMFLDSDDWIEKETVRCLFELIRSNDADMAAVRFNPVYSDDSENKADNTNGISVFNKEEALATFLFNGYLSPCACGKLWRVKDWEGITFPEGKLFEDQFTIYKVLERIEKSILSDNKYYNYLKRENSIGHSAFSQKTYDLYEAINTEYKYLSSNYPSIISSLNVALVTWEIVFVNMMLRSNAQDDKIIKKIRMDARRYFDECKKSKYISKIRKVQIFLFAYNMPLYKLFYRLYKKKYKYS